MNTTINKEENISIVPIPEKKWWGNIKKEDRSVTILPVNNWDINFVKANGKFNNDTDQKSNSPWPWWKIEDLEVYLFINQVTKLICIRGDIDTANFESGVFIFNLFASDTKINFNISLKGWEKEYLGEGRLCPLNNKTIFPKVKIIDYYVGYDPKEEKKDIQDFIEKVKKESPIGIYKFTYEDYSIKYDIGEINHWGCLEQFLGWEDKNNPKTKGQQLYKISSLIEILSINEKIKWNEITKLLSKKQSQG